MFYNVTVSKIVLYKTPFNGGYSLFKNLDSKINLFPKKYNRLLHAIPRSNSLAIPREFDDIKWPF